VGLPGIVLVVGLPTSPLRLKLPTSPRRLDSERLRQASREAMSGRLFSDLVGRGSWTFSNLIQRDGCLLPRAWFGLRTAEPLAGRDELPLIRTWSAADFRAKACLHRAYGRFANQLL
jgi:hypothetical protein